MKQIFDAVLRESDDDKVTVLGVSRKPMDMIDVLRAVNPQRISVVETKTLNLDKFVGRKALQRFTMEPTEGWTRFEDEEGILPPVYISTEGSDYPRYVAVAASDKEEWNDVLWN